MLILTVVIIHAVELMHLVINKLKK